MPCDDARGWEDGMGGRRDEGNRSTKNVGFFHPGRQSLTRLLRTK